MPQTIFTFESLFADAIVQLAAFSLPEGGPFVLDRIQFGNGVQHIDDLTIMPLAGMHDYSAVEFKLSVPVNIHLKWVGSKEETVLNERLPAVYVRVALYTPLRKQEQPPNIVVESLCQTLSSPAVTGAKIQLVVNNNILIRLSSTQQLVTPSLLGSRFHNGISDHPSCRAEVCEKFLDPAKTNFPKDFFDAGTKAAQNDGNSCQKDP